MSSHSSLPLKYKKGKPNLLVEVANTDKHLLTLIHSKGLLCSDVQELYRRVCSSYEKILLNDCDQAEIQDVEYSLWKLHYRHIDEFRKRIKKSSASDNTMPQNGANVQIISENHVEGFKSFLSEAIEFYQNLIVKIKRYYELPEESSIYKKGYISTTVEPKKLQKCQFLCHRFLVCLGDLARYKEQYENFGAQEHNWSVAVSHYLEATMIWPDSGNPQNQLAVLANYVGDEFLALYHCVRSLAVKEPFPDAWNNLILLFERNRSSDLHSISREAQFDFLKPSERSSNQIKSQSSDGFSNCNMLKGEHDCFSGANLWSLIIRTISFFFIKSSLEDFPYIFASTMQELDATMELDDVKLKAMLESYQLVHSARTGPFRAIQVVSIFIFTIENLTNTPEIKGLKNKTDMQQLEFIRWALSAMFIFMGRLVERCLKSNTLDSSPLLSSVLVFVEWLVGILDQAEGYGSDDKSRSSMSYFFGAFVGLLKQFNARSEVSSPERTALWEDYELRGFAPVSCSHESLDFSVHYERIKSFEGGNECRAARIINAAMKIANRSIFSQKWIIYDKAGTKFSVADSNVNADTSNSEVELNCDLKVKEPHQCISESHLPDSNVNEVELNCDLKVKEPHQCISESHLSDSNVNADTSNSEVELNCDLKVKEPHQCISESTEEYDKQMQEENETSPSVHGKSVSMEEEEVIVFKPLTRYNSAPVYAFINTKDPESPKDTEEQTVPPDECLRRATSLLIAQNQSQGDALGFHSDITNFRPSKPFKQQEPPVKETGAPSFSPTAISAGPPSLSSWVFNRGSGNNEREKGRSETSKLGLSPIEEIASASLSSLSINQTEDSVIRSGRTYASRNYTSPYSAPLPSAPLLPDNASWLNDVQPTFSDFKNSEGINRAGSLSNAAPLSSYPNWNATRDHFNFGSAVSAIPDFMNGYPPYRGMSSSEWLRQYRENHNLDPTNNYSLPPHHYTPRTSGNFHNQDASRLNLLDQWQVPLASNQMIYAERPMLHPGIPQIHAADELRRDKIFPGYQRPTPYGCSVVTDFRDEPQPLLQYLKEREWLLQRDPTLRGPPYMGN